MLKKMRSAIIFAGAVASGSVSARATVIEVNNSGSAAYTVSATDLLTGIAPVAVGNFGPTASDSGTNNVAVLTDGLFGSAAPSSEPADPNTPFSKNGNETLVVQNNDTLTYTFPSLTNIGMINVYGAWNDNGRDQQAYTVLTSTDGTTFSNTLASVSFNPAGSPVPSDTFVSLTNSGGGFMVTNVKAIEFSFGTQENGYAGYKEIDVFSTPEPASLSLLSLGALGLLSRPKRK